MTQVLKSSGPREKPVVREAGFCVSCRVEKGGEEGGRTGRVDREGGRVKDGGVESEGQREGEQWRDSEDGGEEGGRTRRSGGTAGREKRKESGHRREQE